MHKRDYNKLFDLLTNQIGLLSILIKAQQETLTIQQELKERLHELGSTIPQKRTVAA